MCGYGRPHRHFFFVKQAIFNAFHATNKLHLSPEIPVPMTAIFITLLCYILVTQWQWNDYKFCNKPKPLFVVFSMQSCPPLCKSKNSFQLDLIQGQYPMKIGSISQTIKRWNTLLTHPPQYHRQYLQSLSRNIVLRLHLIETAPCSRGVYLNRIVKVLAYAWNNKSLRL